MAFDAQEAAGALLARLDAVAERLHWGSLFQRRTTDVIDQDATGRPTLLSISFDDAGIGIDIGAAVPVPSLTGARTARGYRVWEVVGTHGSFDVPPDAWDVDLMLTASATDAISGIGARIVSRAVDELFSAEPP